MPVTAFMVDCVHVHILGILACTVVLLNLGIKWSMTILCNISLILSWQYTTYSLCSLLCVSAIKQVFVCVQYNI